MDSNFIGEIRAFPYSFIPVGWLLCDGSQVNIQAYQLLYAVIGGIYGYSDNRNFTLPNLQGVTPMGANAANPPLTVGKKGGSETITLTANNLPSHNHTAYGDRREATQKDLATNTPSPAVFLSNMTATTAEGKTPSVYSYVDVTPQTTSITPNPMLLGNTGGSTPHNNMMPYLPMILCICATDGVFPVRD